MDRVDGAAVEGGRRVCTRLGDAADDLGDVLRRPVATSGSTRSGENARWKSTPATRPLRSSTGRNSCVVVPGYVVDSRTTSCPRRSRVAISAAAPRRMERSGSRCGTVGLGARSGSRRRPAGRRSPSSRPGRPARACSGRRPERPRCSCRRGSAAPRAWRRRRPARRTSRPRRRSERAGRRRTQRRRSRRRERRPRPRSGGGARARPVGSSSGADRAGQGHCDPLQARPSPYSGGRSRGIAAASTAATIASGSSSTSTLAPCSTVSTHSVEGRSVAGTPYQYASF